MSDLSCDLSEPTDTVVNSRMPSFCLTKFHDTPALYINVLDWNGDRSRVSLPGLLERLNRPYIEIGVLNRSILYNSGMQ